MLVVWLGCLFSSFLFLGNGHGTHVASTVAGGQYGVAKKANLIAVKVLRSSGYGSMADVIKGVQWAATRAKASPRRSAANMSLGGGRSAALDQVIAKVGSLSPADRLLTAILPILDPSYVD